MKSTTVNSGSSLKSAIYYLQYYEPVPDFFLIIINLFKITAKCIDNTIWYRKFLKTNISYINKDVNCSQIVQSPLQ